MDAAIILAGGPSRRSGRQHKACRRLPGERRNWIDRQVDILRQAGFAPVCLVTGYRPRRVLACLHRRVHKRHNRKARQGPFATLRVGLYNRSGHVLVVPVDTILPPARWLRRLKRCMHAADIRTARPIDRWGGGGHPLMLSGKLIPHLCSIPLEAPDARLDRQLGQMSESENIRSPWNHFARYPRLNTHQEWLSARRKLGRAR
ncbi:nucleotidyltransferase family protein [Acidithiobacillus sulfuriphilus]|uniref:nucleotidyltransferase family protein n=1 Tax=Acidithiobacillus sulfuriphilus TaxID=1867749 RepID=UPI003F6172AD